MRQIEPRYEYVKQQLLICPGVIAQPMSYGLEFMGYRRFVTLLVYKTYLKVIFTLTYPVDEFTIDHYTRMSKNRYAHVVNIDTVAEVDEQLSQ